VVCILYFVHFIYFVYSVCVLFFLNGHRKNLSEPGVSCPESISLVLHHTVSSFFEEINDDDDDDIRYYASLWFARYNL